MYLLTSIFKPEGVNVGLDVGGVVVYYVQGLSVCVG